MLDYERAKNNGLEKVLDETRKELQAAKSASLKSKFSHFNVHSSRNQNYSNILMFTFLITVNQGVSSMNIQY